MRFLTCYQNKNRCYQKATKANMVGILIHSTGAVNTECRRYVDYPEELGKNQYNNHWNQSSADKCMHGFVGLDKDGNICFVNTLPYNFACWGCGGGKNGSRNYDPQAHIQFEICEGSKTNADYYHKAIEAAEIVCATLCKKYGWNASKITSHKESAAAGYASNHGDPESYMANFGDNMVKFRERVQARLAGGEVETVVTETETETTTKTETTTTTTTNGAYTMSTLRKGDKGKQVMVLQWLLNLDGYALNIDGIFGNDTQAVTRAYQAKYNLTTDGIVGKNTWGKLFG